MRGRSGRSGSSRGSYGGRTSNGYGRNSGHPTRQTRQSNRDFRRGAMVGMGTSRMMRRRRRPVMMMGPRRRSGGGLITFIIILILLSFLFNLLF